MGFMSLFTVRLLVCWLDRHSLLLILYLIHLIRLIFPCIIFLLISTRIKRNAYVLTVFFILGG